MNRLHWIVISMFLFLASARVSPAFAANDLSVDFHGGGPLFTFANSKPGDHQEKLVDVTNNTNGAQVLAVKLTKKNGSSGTPILESSLQLSIQDGSSSLYGMGSSTGVRTLEQAFTQSSTGDGIVLTSLSAHQTKTFTMSLLFPLSAGNEFQNKTIGFDIAVGSVQSSHLVINEVYYHVDQTHWHGLTQDHRDSTHDLDDGGWWHDWFWQKKWWVFRKDYQWVELYNPTDTEVSLKNWSVTNTSGNPVIFHANQKLKGHSYALIAKDDSVWRFWKLPKGVLTIEEGKGFGNGLNPLGDHLILKNNSGVEIDRMSWGNDTSGFSPPAQNPMVARGRSTVRVAAGFDTNTVSDWQAGTPPTPGK